MNYLDDFLCERQSDEFELLENFEQLWNSIIYKEILNELEYYVI